MTPRFVPFEAMSDAEQREHLFWLHNVTCDWGEAEKREDMRRYQRQRQHDILTVELAWNHTHDKPAPRPEENR